jgi:hypothetical protein
MDNRPLLPFQRRRHRTNNPGPARARTPDKIDAHTIKEVPQHIT